MSHFVSHGCINCPKIETWFYNLSHLPNYSLLTLPVEQSKLLLEIGTHNPPGDSYALITHFETQIRNDDQATCNTERPRECENTDTLLLTSALRHKCFGYREGDFLLVITHLKLVLSVVGLIVTTDMKECSWTRIYREVYTSWLRNGVGGLSKRPG